MKKTKAKTAKTQPIQRDINRKGLQQPTPFPIFAGTNPRQEYISWQARVGKRAGFHINSTRFGPPVLILDKVEFKASHINNTGQILEGEITLTFAEDVNQVIAPAATTELYFGDIALPETTPGYNPNANNTAKSAYNVRPSASAAAEKARRGKMKASGNGDPAQCVGNLLRIVRGEVPYERLKGLNVSLIDQPSSNARQELIADAQWLIENYEPRINIDNINLTAELAKAGHFNIKVNTN